MTLPSVMDRVRVMVAVDTHFKSGIVSKSSIPKDTQSLFQVYATCTDIYGEHAKASKAILMSQSSTQSNDSVIANAATDAVKSYLSKTYPPVSSIDLKAEIEAQKLEVKHAEAMLRESIKTCKAMRGAYKP